MDQELLLSVKDLSIRYVTDDGIVQAVNNINFDIKDGETLGLVGETGAGKTTTALGLMGLLPNPPSEIPNGEIILEGENLLKASNRRMRQLRGKNISMIFQDPMTALNPVQTVGEQIAEIVRIHEKCSRKDAERKAAEMLQVVGIPSERMNEYPHQFSGGMKQRVVIAMAIACQPKLIIADEPTTALDVTIQAQVLSLMKNLQQKYETGMLMITHDLGVVAEVCDKVAVIYAGKIVEIGSLEDIYDRTAHPYTKGLFGALPKLAEKSRRLHPIDGLMPDPIDIPAGCPFNPRCPNRMPCCDKLVPSEVEVTDGHKVCCFLYANNKPNKTQMGEEK